MAMNPLNPRRKPRVLIAPLGALGTATATVTVWVFRQTAVCVGATVNVEVPAVVGVANRMSAAVSVTSRGSALAVTPHSRPQAPAGRRHGQLPATVVTKN